MSAAKKTGSAQALAIALTILAVIGVLIEALPFLLSTATTGSPSSPGPTTVGFTAYCPGSPVTPAGVYAAGPGTTPPPGCNGTAQTISATIQDLYNPGKALTSAYSCVFYWNAGTPAIFTPTGPGVMISGGSWRLGPSVSATAGECDPTGWAPNTGTQVVVKVCDDTAANCVAGGYSSQKTVAYCPLASQVPSVTPISGTSAPSQACNPGPGWGSIPYVIIVPGSTPVLQVTVPIVMIAGQNPTGSNSGYNSATPVLLDERYQNGTDFTSASTCFVNTGSNACDLPKASSLGRFGMTWTLSTGACSGCTAFANPGGAGYSTATPVDLQTGTGPRGPLQLVLSIEVKATTNNDMCTITTPTLLGAAPVVQVKTATDVFYLFVIPDLSVTKITDVSGNALNVGSAKLGIQLDCNPVYNGSGDVVTITPILYAYYSIAYTQSYHGTLVNPEAAIMTQSAVITVRT